MSYFKVVNADGEATYFSEDNGCVFDPPLKRVKSFLKRNSDKSYTVYIETSKPKPFPRWEVFHYDFS